MHSPLTAKQSSLFGDGSLGVATVNLALRARTRYGWAAAVPREIFRSAVLPYANVNEARTDWRQLFTDAIQPMLANVANSTALEDVALLINSKLWSTLGSQFSPRGAPITFKSEQTPLIYDPLSTVLFGSASCTGISITSCCRVGWDPRTARWNARMARQGRGWQPQLGRSVAWHRSAGSSSGAPAGAGGRLKTHAASGSQPVPLQQVGHSGVRGDVW